MDERALEAAKARVAAARAQRPGHAEVGAALERARAQVEELAAAAAGLESSLPERVEAAVREGVRREAAPIGRQLAEVRGLSVQLVRRLERMEGGATAERHARVDDLAVLVDLVASGWKSVDDRLARIERAMASQGATVHHLGERRLDDRAADGSTSGL